MYPFFRQILTRMAKAFCDELIASAKVAVISKSYCPFCVKAKNILKSYVGKGLQESDIKIVEIENRPDCDAIQDYMLQLTKARSVSCSFV